VDIADETGGDGTDTVNASVTFCLADTVHAKGSIENLTLTGTGAINATTGDEKKNAAIDYMIEKLAYVEESKLCGSNTEYMIAL
jgi:hypothetical protein